MTIFYNLIISLEKIPMEWKSGMTILIYKKEERKNLRNYHVICLLNIVKLLTRISIFMNK